MSMNFITDTFLAADVQTLPDKSKNYPENSV
jgi:hypothetical protein